MTGAVLVCLSKALSLSLVNQVTYDRSPRPLVVFTVILSHGIESYSECQLK